MHTLRDLSSRPDFRVGPLSVSPSRRMLQGPLGMRSLQPLVMQVFLRLLDADGQVVTRDELFEQCWGRAIVGEDSLNRTIANVRRVVTEVAPGLFEIETIPRTGYRISKSVADGDPPIVAVLPFANAEDDPGQDYFVEAMADEIVTALTRIRTLRVISNESSASLKGKTWEEQCVAAAAMGARYVLTGTVRRSGSQLRIAAKLLDIGGDVQIWADRLDDQLTDLFALLDRIALEVATAIEPTISEAEVRRGARQPVENLGCYDLYLRAVPLRARCKKAEVIQALELLDRALALDPHFAPALAQAAGCHSQIYENAWSKKGEWHRTQGLILADRALMRGADDGAVLAQVANALMDLEGNVARATALAERAVTINPGLARAWFISGLARLLDHDGETAIRHLETAARLDPISPLNDVIRAHIGVARSLTGDYRGGLNGICATRHRTARIHLTLAALYGYLEMPLESREELKQFERQSPMSAEEMIAIAIPHTNSRTFLLEGLRLGCRPGTVIQ